MAVCIIGVPIAVTGFVLVSDVVFGANGCRVDLIPGDYGSMAIVNDTSDTVQIRLGGETAILASGQQTHEGYELCAGNSIAITSGTGAVIGCLTLPIQDPQNVNRLLISANTPCRL